MQSFRYSLISWPRVYWHHDIHGKYGVTRNHQHCLMQLKQPRSVCKLELLVLRESGLVQCGCSLFLFTYYAYTVVCNSKSSNPCTLWWEYLSLKAVFCCCQQKTRRIHNPNHRRCQSSHRIRPERSNSEITLRTFSRKVLVVQKLLLCLIRETYAIGQFQDERWTSKFELDLCLGSFPRLILEIVHRLVPLVPPRSTSQSSIRLSTVDKGHPSSEKVIVGIRTTICVCKTLAVSSTSSWLRKILTRIGTRWLAI